MTTDRLMVAATTAGVLAVIYVTFLATKVSRDVARRQDAAQYRVGLNEAAAPVLTASIPV